MIAMQYSFTLPADYDMSIIDRRISVNGPKLDGFPDLGFKAYLSARRGEMGSPANLYAPFYLWRKSEGIDAFLTGPGFKSVSDAFGWPAVASWIVWDRHVAETVAGARFALRRVSAIEPFEDLAARRAAAVGALPALTQAGAVACLTGFDPRQWTQVEFSLWHEAPPQDLAGQAYRVGHVST
jgi:hypothetical protein